MLDAIHDEERRSSRATRLAARFYAGRHTALLRDLRGGVVAGRRREDQAPSVQFYTDPNSHEDHARRCTGRRDGDRSMGHDNTCRISRVCDRLYACG